jgi:O-antigen/teichoic acid export membrane protein
MYQSAFDETVEAPSPAFADPRARDARGALVGGALWLLFSNLAYAACQWGALAALAKLGTAAALGHFGLALAVATPVVLVTGFALRAVQATDVQRRYSFAAYLNLRLAANAVAAAIIAAAAHGVLDPAAAAVLLPIGTAKLAEATSETCYGLAQRHDRMRFVALSKVVRGALGLAGLVTVVALGGSVAEGAWALAAVWTAFLFAVDLPVSATLERAVAWTSPATLWKLSVESAPLGLVNGVLAATQSLPRYLLQLSHGPAAVGYFTALAALGPALDQLAGSIGNAAAPRLGWAAASNARRYRRLVVQLLLVAVAISGILTTAAAIGGPAFLRLAYRPDYGAFRMAFVLVVLGAGFTIINSVSYFALVAARRAYAQLGIQCLGLGITAVSGAFLVHAYGVDGAAASIALGSGVMAAVAAWILLRREK